MNNTMNKNILNKLMPWSGISAFGPLKQPTLKIGYRLWSAHLSSRY
jgi:hypothetical protein